MDKTISPPDIEWTDEKVQRLWDYYATVFEPEIYFSKHSGAYILRDLSQWLDFTPGHILDYGCGPGYLMEHLLQKSTGKVFGLDFSKDSVMKSNALLSGHPHFGGAIQAVSLPCAYESNTMDLVIAVEVIEHLSNDRLKTMLSEIRRLLKVGGRLLLTTPNEEILEDSTCLCPNCGVKYHRWQHVRSWSVTSLTDLLLQNGFSPRAVRSTFFISNEARLTNAIKDIVKRLIGKKVTARRPHLFAIAEKVE